MYRRKSQLRKRYNAEYKDGKDYVYDAVIDFFDKKN